MEDPVLNAYASNHNTWAHALSELLIEASRNPRIEAFHNTSWLDGQRYAGICHKDTRGNIRRSRNNKSKVNKA